MRTDKSISLIEFQFCTFRVHLQTLLCTLCLPMHCYCYLFIFDVRWHLGFFFVWFTEVSNWMRFVRPAPSFKEQNLILSQQGSSLYFTTIEVIHPKQELLVWYGVWYSQTRNYSLLPGDPCGKFNIFITYLLI